MDDATGFTARDLGWSPGATAISHEVYLGTDPASVNSATTSDPEFAGSTAGPSYRVNLEDATTYYWRVDTVTQSGTIKGVVWSFTTGILPPGSQTARILVNFERNANEAFTGGQEIGPTRDSSTNWNSVVTASGSSSDLINNIGDVTTAGITWSSANTWNNEDSTSSDDGRLSRGYLDDGGSGVTVTLSGIPYANYRVYGLFASDQNGGGSCGVANANVNGSWVLGGGSGTTASAWGSVSANTGANGESWTEIDPGGAQGNYWTIETSGSVCTINIASRSGSNRGSLTGVIIEEIELLPNAPINLIAAGGDGSVSLTWVDDSSDESGFIVQRSSIIAGGFTTIHTTAANTTNYTDAGLEDGTKYFYQVIATNAAGDSAPTSQQNATTWTAAESWRHSYFGQTANAGDAADGNDFDGDGVVNLLERAFGTIPNDGASWNLPKANVTEDSGQDYLALSYRRRIGGSGAVGVDYTVNGLTYTVEYDTDLIGPWSSGSVAQVGSAIDNGDGTESVTVRMINGTTAGIQQFMRLKITVNP